MLLSRNAILAFSTASPVPALNHLRISRAPSLLLKTPSGSQRRESGTPDSLTPNQSLRDRLRARHPWRERVVFDSLLRVQNVA
ncbi:MAG: hypothetical protein IPK97_09015 [Ahniella sp.]|nr:hypothetical protein [Ahniella sp.]